MNISELRNAVEQLKGKKQQLEASLQTLEFDQRNLKRKQRQLEDSREIVRLVGMKTQEQLQYHISDIASLALESVYDYPYKLLARFVQRRNKSECDLLFSRNGEEILEPIDASGGGVINLASFALRVASWTMQSPRTNNVLILDEPFGNVSVDLLPRVSDMVQQISHKLGLQIIMITHAEELMEMADKVFKVGIKNGVSAVMEYYGD